MVVAIQTIEDFSGPPLLVLCAESQGLAATRAFLRSKLWGLPPNLPYDLGMAACPFSVLLCWEAMKMLRYTRRKGPISETGSFWRHSSCVLTWQGAKKVV
jgi:hypothetical protein